MEGALTSGKKWASGTVDVGAISGSYSRSWVQVTGLDFKPNVVILTLASSSSSSCARYVLSIRSGHSLLSNAPFFTSGRDYVMYALPYDWSYFSVPTGTMTSDNSYQMGANSFIVPIYDGKEVYETNIKYNWYAIE